jgi:dipeptidyl aminopeptidase/acylaminoacyl peptidase
MAGTSDAGNWIAALELGGLPHTDPAPLRARSPLERVAAVSTPTLLVHGGADGRAPGGQPERWFTALRSRRIDTQLVRYPGAGHLFIVNGRPSHRADYARRLVSWVTEHTGGQAAAAARRR